MSPVQLFFFVNVVPFFVEWLRKSFLSTDLSGSEIVAPLGSWHNVSILANAMSIAAGRVGITLEQFRQLLDHRIEVLAKTLLILLVPLFSLVVWPLYSRTGPLLKHVLYALHFNDFVLLYTTAISVAFVIWGWQTRVMELWRIGLLYLSF